MPKALTISGMVVAALLFLLFGLDLALRFPFSRQQPVTDVIFVVSALILAYLSWVSFKELR